MSPFEQTIKFLHKASRSNHRNSRSPSLIPFYYFLYYYFSSPPFSFVHLSSNRKRNYYASHLLASDHLHTPSRSLRSRLPTLLFVSDYYPTTLVSDYPPPLDPT